LCLRAGVDVQESLRVRLPNLAVGVYTLRASTRMELYRYLVITFSSSTMILVISNGSVNQVTDSGILTNVYSHNVMLMADDSIAQVVFKGVYHLTRERRVFSWSCPPRLVVLKVVCVARQVVLALTGGGVVYLELEIAKHKLSEHHRRNFGGGVSSMDILECRVTNCCSNILAVGMESSQLIIVSLASLSFLGHLYMHNLETSYASALAFMYIQLEQSRGVGDGNFYAQGQVYLYVGTENGILMRGCVDVSEGVLGGLRWRYVGVGCVRLSVVAVQGRTLLFALSRLT
jgi:splicing factor 3B subunit 3